MTVSIKKSADILALLQDQVQKSSTVETNLWNQMTDEVLALITKISDVTSAVFKENASIEQECILLEENRRRSEVVARSHLSLLKNQCRLLEKQIECLESKIKETKQELGLHLFDDNMTISRYLEAIDAMRKCFKEHKHAPAFGTPNESSYILSSKPFFTAGGV